MLTLAGSRGDSFVPRTAPPSVANGFLRSSCTNFLRVRIPKAFSRLIGEIRSFAARLINTSLWERPRPQEMASSWRVVGI
jgi:hypothetical protein